MMARRARLWLVITTVSVAVLLLAAGGVSRSAYRGSITNNANVSNIGVYTCQAAELADNPVRMYSLGARSGGSNQGSAGPAGNATFQGGQSTSSGGACAGEDQSYTNFVPPNLIGLGGRWVSTGGSIGISATSAITQEAWVKTSSGQGQIMGFGDNQSKANGSAQKGLQVFFTSAGRIDFATYQNETNQELLTPGGVNLADGAWHQVVAVYNAGTKKLYVDGQLSASGSGPSEAIKSAYWRLGNDSFVGWVNAPKGTGATYLNGGMQYAALYTSALSADQVRTHYLAGRGDVQ